MPRMYVEGRVGTLDSPREAAHKLMIELDAEAAAAGQRVVGDVSIYEVQHPIIEGPMLRLEADVEAV